MKKIFIAIIYCNLFALNSWAQITNGYYKIQLIASGGYLTYEDINSYGRITVNNACTGSNCDNQIWLVKKIQGNGAGGYTIQSPINQKLITWGYNGSSADLAPLKIQSASTITDVQTSVFIFDNKDGAETAGGFFHIMPSTTRASTSQSFLGQEWAGYNIHAATDHFSASMIRPTTTGSNANKEDNFNWMLLPAKATVNLNNAPRDLGNNTPSTIPIQSQNKIEIDIKTGSDNLEPKSTQHNAELRVILNGKADVIKQNINEGQEWKDNSIHRITLDLPATITATDIKEIHIYRKRDGLQYVWQLGEKDNWNIDRVTANATIVTNGVKNRIPILETGATRPRVPGANDKTIPLFRFVYEGGDGVSEGQVFKLVIPPLGTPSLPPPVSQNVPRTNASVLVIFGTGGDNLEGGNDNNVDMTFRFNSGRREILWQNVNGSQKLNNFSEANFRKQLPNTQDLDINDIKEIELRHTGGGGIFADNWHVDKIKIIVTKDGISKTLLDKVDSPIHMFTGDSRRKTFRTTNN